MSNKKKWLETTYKQASERPVRFSTVSDMELDPLYTPDDVTGSYDDTLGNPGEFPGHVVDAYGFLGRDHLACLEPPGLRGARRDRDGRTAHQTH